MEMTTSIPNEQEVRPLNDNVTASSPTATTTGGSSSSSPMRQTGNMAEPITSPPKNMDSPRAKQQLQQQHTSNDIVLAAENDRLRGELLELRQRMRQMEEEQRQQHQQQRHHDLSIQHYSSNNLNSHNRKNHNQKLYQQKKSVLLELPVTLRTCSSSDSFNNNNKSQKDHLSVSTADDRETIEPNMDIEAHESAAGLHYRSHSHNNTPTTATTTSNTTISSSSLKTRRTDNITEYSSSSSDDDNNDDGDDPIAESRVLLGGDSPRCRDGIVLEGTNVAALAGDDNHRQQEQMTFWQSLTDRASWLIGLLILQSLSSFILAHNESLLAHHPVIIQFLTMLVGAGGNAGNQASVGVVRGIAIGTVNRSNARKVIRREFAMGVALSIILGFVGFVRAKAFSVPWMETIAITASLSMIVIISVVVGATLPLCMEYVGIDPAHSSTTIQVIMDITGVIIMVHVSTLMLDSDFHDWLAIALSLDGETR
jgi:cation transporter-like permease